MKRNVAIEGEIRLVYVVKWKCTSPKAYMYCGYANQLQFVQS
jgi:hypothetical protein